MSDISKLHNDMAFELLNASESLDNFCYACGMRDTDNGWAKCDNSEWWYHLNCVKLMEHFCFAKEF